MDIYDDPVDFLKNLGKYSKEIQIFLDNDLNSDLSGIDLAKQLYEMGFTQLYLISGKDFEKDEIPNYVTVIAKTDIEDIEKIVYAA